MAQSQTSCLMLGNSLIQPWLSTSFVKWRYFLYASQAQSTENHSFLLCGNMICAFCSQVQKLVFSYIKIWIAKLKNKQTNPKHQKRTKKPPQISPQNKETNPSPKLTRSAILYNCTVLTIEHRPNFCITWKFSVHWYQVKNSSLAIVCANVEFGLCKSTAAYIKMSQLR